MQVGDWVLARRDASEDLADGGVEAPWVPAKLVETDDTSIPWCVVFIGGVDRHWRFENRVRPPETDEEWAAVVAAQLIEGTEHG